jgi:Tol biopolymer transport system component
VPPTGAFYRGLTFSHDGAHLYYLGYDANDFDHGTLYRVPLLGGAPRKLIADLMSAITLSPDETQAAFVRVNQAEGSDDLIVARLDGAAERKLATRKHPDRFGYASAPAWSPDGSRLAVAIEKSDEQGHYVNLATVRVDDGTQKPFSPKRWMFVERMAWLANGSGLLMVGQDPDSTFQQIWDVPANGRMPHKLNNDLNDYIGLSLTADSRLLATLQIQVVANIWIAPNGNADRAVQITPGAGRFYAGQHVRIERFHLQRCAGFEPCDLF